MSAHMYESLSVVEGRNSLVYLNKDLILWGRMDKNSSQQKLVYASYSMILGHCNTCGHLIISFKVYGSERLLTVFPSHWWCSPVPRVRKHCSVCIMEQVPFDGSISAVDDYDPAGVTSNICNFGAVWFFSPVNSLIKDWFCVCLGHRGWSLLSSPERCFG